MAISLTHAFRSPKKDGTDATLVQPSAWNEEHTIEMTGPALFGRVTGTGVVEEIPLSDNMTFVDGALATTAFADFGETGGASSIGADDYDGGSLWTNVQAFMAHLLSSVGSSVVGFVQASPVSAPVSTYMETKLREHPVSLDDTGVSPVSADCGPELSQLLDDMKQATSISYGASVPMDVRKSVSLVGQYVVKNTSNLWAKTEVRATNGLNSGLTLAADATDDAIFQLSGSTALPAWGNQNNIIGGAYNILKTDGALVRKNPDFPRAYNAVGGSFMTNYAIEDVTFAGPYGIQLGDVYSQNVRITNLSCVGEVEQILSIQGHHILIDGLDKTGFTGSSSEPLIVLGDPDNINPTTNITLSRCILDLNGDAAKDSVHVVNAKNTLIDGHHNELTAFDHMLKVEDSYGTQVERSVFVTATTTDVIALDNSDLRMDAFEANTFTGKWWEFFTRTNKSPLRIGRLRQFFSAGLPVDEDITVKEIQNVSGAEPMIDVPFMNLAGNVCKNPGFVDGIAGWSIDGSLTATLVAGNKVVPGGQILRLTVGADSAGVKFITTTLAGMGGAAFTNRPMTFIMLGEVTGTGADSFMGPAETGLGVNQGRIYVGQGLVAVGAVMVGSNGTAYFHVTNPKAGAQYDIHYLCAQFGRQMTPVLPIPMQPLVADPTGGATVDAESRASIASIIDALQAAGIMRTT